MGHVYYAMAGEGRGHATRARTVIEALRSQHRVTVYAFHQAHDILAPVYRDSDVTIRKIPGLCFRYAAGGRLDYASTVLGAIPFLRSLPEAVRRIARDMEADAPTLAITDFEPLLPRAAKLAGVPFISLDHQHFLTAYDLGSLPFKLRTYAALLAPSVHAFYRGQIRTIVSSFYSPPLRRARPDISRVGVLLRPEIMNANPHEGDHLVAYLRRHIPERVLTSLEEAGQPVRVYGLGARPSRGNLSFHEVDMFRFVDDLASCRALVSTAGNQLVGEALSLRKPVLAMPEVGNHEQAINGHFLARSGAGVSESPLTMTPELVRGFLDGCEAMRERIDTRSVSGNSTTLALIEQQIQQIEAGEVTEHAKSPTRKTRTRRLPGTSPIAG